MRRLSPAATASPPPLQLLPLLLAAAAASAAPSSAAAASPLPHLVFVLADDLGFAAPGYRNAQLVTPALDALAAEGVILDNHYTYKYCSPTRGSLLTGRWPFKLESTRNNLIPFSQEDGLNLNLTLLPQRLKAAAVPYSTNHIGKWHQVCDCPLFLCCRGHSAIHHCAAFNPSRLSMEPADNSCSPAHPHTPLRPPVHRRACGARPTRRRTAALTRATAS